MEPHFRDRSRHIHPQRHDDFTTLAFSGVAKLPFAPPEDLMPLVLEHLTKHVNNRPKRKKPLLSHLRAFLRNAVTEADVVDLVEKLSKAGRLSTRDKDAVTYHD